MTGGMPGFGNSATAPAEDEGLFDLEGSVLMTVSPEKTVSLVISLDEQDIAKVSVGQKATVKVEALSGEIFEAEVTEVSLRGSNSGGSSKFAVELTMPMQEQMLPGMSAVAYIPLYTKTDVLTVPVAALVEEGSKTLICKGLDPETGDPANPVEVTTGVSDGEKVEILSGLSEGQKVYYSYYDTVELDTSAKADKYTLR